MSDHPLVSVLFITYKRVHLLRRTLETFLANTAYPNLELVVTDDGSPASMQQEISKLPFHKHILPMKRRGMGANANEGLRHCAGDYILFLQDDWECAGPDTYLREAVDSLKQYTDLGFIRFTSVDTSLNSSVGLSDVPRPLRLLERPGVATELNRNIYSDRPHLKSKAFVEFMGPYLENTAMEECERDFQDRFLRQSRFKAGFFPDFNDRTFLDIGERESFRTNSLRFKWEMALSDMARPFRGSALHKFGNQTYRQAVRLFAKTRLLK